MVAKSKLKVKRYPVMQQLPDTGEYAAMVSKVIEAKNTIITDTAFESVSEPGRPFAQLPDYPLASKTERVGRWYPSIIATRSHIYINIPTALIQMQQLYVFPNTVEYPSIAFYDNVAYVSSESNKAVKIDLSVIRETVDPSHIDIATEIVEEIPYCRSLTNVGPYLVAGYTKKADESHFIPHRGMWSAANNPTDWDVVDSEGVSTGTRAGYYFFRAISEIVDLTKSASDLVVFGRTGIIYGQLGSGPLTFIWNTIANAGLVARNCFAVEGRDIYWLSVDGFYKLNGGRELLPIGLNIINETVLERINWAEIGRADCSVIPELSAIVWSLPVDGADYNNLVVLYNYQTGNFSLLDLNIARVIRYGAPPITLNAANPAIEGVRTAAQAGMPSIEDLPYPLDSPVWTGKASEFAFIESKASEAGYGLRALHGSQQLQAEIKYPISEFVDGYKSDMHSMQAVVEGTDYTDPDHPTQILFDISHGDDMRLANRIPTLEADEGGFVRIASTNSRYHQWTMKVKKFSKIKLLTATYVARAAEKGVVANAN